MLRRIIRRTTTSTAAAAVLARPSSSNTPLSLTVPTHSHYTVQQRYETTSTKGGSTTGAAKKPTSGTTTPPTNYEGVIALNAANLKKELQSVVPTMLYFHVPHHPEVAKFTKELCEQVTIANKAHRMAAQSYEAVGEDRGLAVRLATIDCMKEVQLAQQFGVDPNQFPMILFLYKQQVLDRLVGIVPEAQSKEAIETFIKVVQQEIADSKAGKGPAGLTKVPRMDNDDENIMTLIQTAQKKLKDNDFAKGEALYNKAVDIGRQKVAEAKTKLGLDKKKMTPELFDKLKADPHYFALAQALAGVAMCHVSQKRFDEAKKITENLRSEFPAAIKELRDVAEAVARVELLFLTDFDLEKDNYVSLMKREEVMDDPAVFYKTNVKLAAAHLFEKRHKAGIEECLRLIRAEPKLLPALKKAGVVPENASLSSKDGTPARKVLFLIFEALGNNHEYVIEGRKKLSAYLSL